MKKLLICILFMLVIPVCLLLTGCGTHTGESNSDFIIISEERFDGNRISTILVHKETKVMYFFVP